MPYVWPTAVTTKTNAATRYKNVALITPPEARNFPFSTCKFASQQPTKQHSSALPRPLFCEVFKLFGRDVLRGAGDAAHLTTVSEMQSGDGTTLSVRRSSHE